MDSIATECKKRKHHPEWANVYNRVHIRWTTHSPRGLSEKDVDMAQFCEAQAQGLGEVIPDNWTDEKLKRMAEAVGKGTGDCCEKEKKG